jgi:hypothetical protein
MNTGTVTSQGVTANFGDTAFTGAVPAGFTSGFTKDPTVLLVHADGANGSTTFTDVSPSGHPLTSLGGAQAPAINTTNPKFGTGSAAFTGSNGNIQISNTPAGDFNFGAGQFTVEAWAYFTSTPTGTQIVLGNFNVAPNLGWDFGFNSGQLAFYYSTTGSDNPNVGGAYSPTLNTWIHLAADRDVSNVLRVYANGAVIASATVSATFFASISLYLIGNDNTNIRGFPGNLDEVRITKSLARYAGAFTPPTAPFTTLDTNMLTTQAAVEEWASGAPAMQLTQAVIEEWGSVTTYSPYTTWSTTDTTAGITLSNSDLTVATSTINQGVRSKDRQITGKFYWEATGTTWPANVDIGIANASAVLSTAGAAGQNCIYLGNTGAIWVNNVNSGSTLGARASGDIIGIALDLTNQLIWFRVAPSGNWNGSATANPATGVGGLSTSVLGGPAFPIHALFCQTTASATSFTANFGAAAFSGTVPSGFTSGFPSSAVIPVNTLATQLALDHWAAPAAPAAQLTNISIEQWAQVATVNPQAVLTQITLDQWATVAMAGVPSTGNGPMISIII